MVTDGINSMKDYLKSTMNKLYEMIDFLKEELTGGKQFTDTDVNITRSKRRQFR